MKPENDITLPNIENNAAARAAATVSAVAQIDPITEMGAATSPSNASISLRPNVTQAIAAAAARSSATLTPGTVIRERFTIMERLGAGGMGTVYRALDRNKEQFQERNPYVAIKVLNAQLVGYRDALIALQREARREQELAHPNIVSVYDFDIEGNTFFVSMELLEGETLDQTIRDLRGEPMPLSRAMPIIQGAGAALAHAHSKNIVHCDFKPNNVFITRRNEVKVLDFGIARAVELAEATQSHTFDAGVLNALTPAFASCEMIERKPPDPRDDIYALACVAYELLGGQRPYQSYPATQARSLGLKPPRLKNLNKRQWDTLRSALSFGRESRPHSVDAFLRGLRGDRRVVMVRSVLWGALLGAVVFAGGVTYFASWSFFSAAGNDAVMTPPTRALTDDEQEKINRLMRAADLNKEMGFIFAPPGNNMLEALTQVVEIDPRNTRARALLKEVAQTVAERAQVRLAAGEANEAQKLVTLGLLADPNNAALKKLKVSMASK